MNSETKDKDFIGQCRKRLQSLWDETASLAQFEPGEIPDDIQQAISRSLSAKIKSYHYVLPTQILAKLVNPDLDCRSIQAGCGLDGAFDARSVCHNVIVPFDRENHRALGGSPEPYVNNPLRIPAILKIYKSSQKNPEEFQDLILVLDYAQENKDKLETLMKLILWEIRQKISLMEVAYPLPNRVSLEHALLIVEKFLSEKSGGRRLQLLAVSLFKCIGQTFNLYAEVRSNPVTAADAATGSAADIECLDHEGNISLVVEVKDRGLDSRQVQDKIPAIREKGIKEFLFLISQAMKEKEKDKINELVKNQFVIGHNLYIEDFNGFLKACLILMGEEGRRRFLEIVGHELNKTGADYKDKTAWRDALTSI